MTSNELQIYARAARIEQDLHPFQRAFNAALEDALHRVICVEAPVGAGKSHIVRTVLDRPHDGQIVLTYPTKILMQTQLAALRDEFSARRPDRGQRRKKAAQRERVKPPAVQSRQLYCRQLSARFQALDFGWM